MKTDLYMVDHHDGSPEAFHPRYAQVVHATSEDEAKTKYLAWYKAKYKVDFEHPLDELLAFKLNLID